MGQAKTLNHEMSWENTLFYDPNSSANLQKWLLEDNNQPSKYINRCANKSIVVLNPTLNVSLYKRANNRYGGDFPTDIISRVFLEREAITHYQLLDLASSCFVHQGFWFFHCANESYWDDYFQKVAAHMYNNTKNKVKGYQFVKIEARWSCFDDAGVIMVSYPYYSNVDFINDSGEIIRALIDISDVHNGGVGRLFSFKHQFYFDSGFDVKFTHHPKRNIYSKDLASNQQPNFTIAEGVQKFLDDVVERLNDQKIKSDN